MNPSTNPVHALGARALAATLAALAGGCAGSGTPSSSSVPSASTPAVSATAAAPGPNVTGRERLAQLAAKERQVAEPVNADVPPPPGVSAALLEPLSGAARELAQSSLSDSLAKVSSPTKATTEDADVDPDDAAEALKLYARAKEKLLLNSANAAATDLQQAAKLDPTSGPIWRELGDALAASGKRSASLTAYTRALARGIQDPRLYFNLGREASRSHRLDEALSLLKQARAFRGSYSDAALPALIDSELGAVLSERGQLAAAAEAFLSAAGAPDPASAQTDYRNELLELTRRKGDLLQNAGDLFCRLGRFRDAAGAYEQAAAQPSLDAGSLQIRRTYAALRCGRPAAAALDIIDRVDRSNARVEDRDLALIKYLAQHSSVGPALSAALAELAPKATTPRDAGRLARARAAALPGGESVKALVDHAHAWPNDASALAELLATTRDDAPAARADLMAALVDDRPLFTEHAAQALFNDARQLPQTILALKSSKPAPTLLRAMLLLKLGMPREAYDTIKDEPPQGPMRSAWLAVRAAAAWAGGRWSVAIAAAQAIEVRGEDGVIWKARALGVTQRFAEAAEIIKPLAERPDLAVPRTSRPETTEALLLSSDLADKSGDPARAERNLQAVLAQDPTNEQAYELLISLEGPGGKVADTTRFSALIRQMRDNLPSGRSLRFLSAGEQAQRQNWPQAEAGLLSLAEEDFSTAGLADSLVTVWLRGGNVARGERWLRDRLERHPDSVDLTVALARLLASSDRAADAETLLVRFAERLPAGEILRTRELVVRESLRDAARADELTRARLEATPRSIEDSVEFARLLLAGSRATDAAAVLRDGLPKDIALTADQVTKVQQTALQAAQRDVARAKGDPVASTTGPVASSVFAVLDERGVAIPLPLLRGRLTAAAAGTNPSDPAARAALAKALGRLRELPANEQSTLVGWIAGDLSDAKLARTQLAFFAALTEVQEPPRELLGAIFMRTATSGLPEDLNLIASVFTPARTRALLQGMTDGAPDASNDAALQAELFYRIAGQAEINAHPEIIDAAYARCLALKPDHALGNNDYGYRLADSNGDLAKAEKLLSVAIKADPDNASVQDSVGWLRYKQGIIDDVKDAKGEVVRDGAVTWIRRAIAGTEGPAHAEMLDHLADALWRQGRADEAREKWTAALKAAENEIRAATELGADESSGGMKLRQMVRDRARAKLEALASGAKPQVSPIAGEPGGPVPPAPTK